MLDWFISAAGVFDLGLIQGLVFAGLAFSVVLSLISLDFPDLSIEGTFPLGAAVTAVALAAGWPPMLTLLLAAGCGAIGGILTGTLHIRFGMSKLLSGICTAAVLYTVNMWIMGNRSNLPVLDIPTIFTWCENFDSTIKAHLYPSSRTFFHPTAIVAVAIPMLGAKVMLDYLLSSEFGVVLRGVGQNEKAVRYHGHNPQLFKMAGLAMSNGCAALAGSVASQYQGFSDANMGVGVLVLALVAVILGQEIFTRFGRSVASPGALTSSALVGIVTYQIILAAVLRAGAPPTSLRLFAGLSLVAVIAFRKRRRTVTFSW
jgi:putative ABC transport system permease protein